MRRSLLKGMSLTPPPVDWRPLAEERVARRGGTLRIEGDHALLLGLGPDPGLDYAWIREHCAVPLVVPVATLESACQDGREALDARLDDWIRVHRDEVRAGVAALVGERPRLRPISAQVDAIDLDDGPPIEASRAAHEAAAKARRIAFLQLRELPELEVVAHGISAEAQAILARAVRRAAAPADDLEILAARRVAIVRAALEDLEATDDDPDALALAARDVLLPLAERWVEPDVLDALLG